MEGRLTTIMLRLKRITRNDNIIEADVYRESEATPIHMIVDWKKKECLNKDEADSLGFSYIFHSFHQLVHLGESNDPRTEDLMMWY